MLLDDNKSDLMVVKVNIANLINTAGHRAGVRQVHGKLSKKYSGHGKERMSLMIGHDMYLYVTCRYERGLLSSSIKIL